MTKRDPAVARERKQSRAAEREREQMRRAADEQERPKQTADRGAEQEPPDSEEIPEIDTVQSPAEADNEAASLELEDDDEQAPIGLPEGASWGLPLARLERRWSWLETRLLVVALAALTLTLVFWIVLRGMKEPVQATIAAGTAFRMLAGACILGVIARVATKGREETQRNAATVVAVLLGVATAKLWRGVGIEYFAGIYDWLQEGSALTLMGGLKGISTRLTMTVALLGASLAAASGTHIAIDVFLRFLPNKANENASSQAAMTPRKYAVVAGTTAAAVVSLAASFAFVDFISITSFGAKPADSMGTKVGHIGEHLSDHFFIFRKQVGFDMGALPNVLSGKKWDAKDRMNGKQWNDFLDDGFVQRFGKEKVAPLKATGEGLSQPRMPFVVLPGKTARGVMVHGFDLVFPLGFLMIGLRLLLRSTLLFAGHVRLEEHEVLPEDEEQEPAAEGNSSDDENGDDSIEDVEEQEAEDSENAPDGEASDPGDDENTDSGEEADEEVSRA